jgi:hypothetical protein
MSALPPSRRSVELLGVRPGQVIPDQACVILTPWKSCYLSCRLERSPQPLSGQGEPIASMNARANQWYLFRDGQQHGPFTDADVANFARLGQLHANDLIWREGFANWRPALTVFPEPRPDSVHSSTHRTKRGQVDVSRSQAARPLPRRGPTWKVVLIALITSIVIGAVSGYAYKHSLTRGAPSMPRSGAAIGARVIGWSRSPQLHSCGRGDDAGRRHASDAPLPEIATAHEA